MQVEPSQSAADSSLPQYQALLEITQVIATHRDLSSLFHDLAERLRSVVQFDLLGVSLYDPVSHQMRLRLFETPLADFPAPPKEFGVDDSLAGWVWKTQDPVLIIDVARESRPLPIEMIRRYGFTSCCALPLTSAARRLGAMIFGSLRAANYTEKDLAFLAQVARQVAVAVDSALMSEQLARERDRLSLLLEINNAVVTIVDLRELMSTVAASVRRLMPHEYIGISLYDAKNEVLRIHTIDFDQSRGLLREGITVPVADAPSSLALRARRPVPVTREEIAEKFESDFAQRVLDEGVQSGCLFPLIAHERLLGTLAVASLREATFPTKDIEVLAPIVDQVAIAVENALGFEQIVEMANKLAEEKLYLEGEIRTANNFEEIMGESRALKRVLKQVETVAPTDTTVLICGETGTGKELIARAIHSVSARRERTLVKVNCAAIPTGLLESELFGHEKGAFTGATGQRIGRFELAHRGTLFLDEVGDIPLELQPKLLRVLQEQEFERLGGNRTIRVDARIIAATNADLMQMVSEKRFRSDLYYRLNVFPVTLPSLRERAEDVSILVSFFVQKYARRFRKQIVRIPAETMAALAAYSWPGNIRELENLVERAVLLTPGDTLNVDLRLIRRDSALGHATVSAPSSLRTLAEVERDYIRDVLRRTGGMIGGAGGAAEFLGLPPSTLRSRMKKLGIK